MQYRTFTKSVFSCECSEFPILRLFVETIRRTMMLHDAPLPLGKQPALLQMKLAGILFKPIYSLPNENILAASFVLQQLSIFLTIHF